jgi:hypothetical protein
MKRLAIACLVLTAFALPVAAQLTYGVTVITDKNTDFKKLKTYVWQSGWDANDKNAHALIVAAVNREMKALGFELKAAGPSDVVVKYAALRRIDVEVSMTADPDATRRQFDVGSLLLLMLEPGTGKELLRARLNKPIELDPGKAENTINSAVAEIFAKYPGRVVKK